MEGSGNLSTAQHIPDSANNHYKSDEFRMYCFKVLPCQKRFSHDWSQCPFSHPTERAKRRDLRCYKYDCIMCPAIEKGEECPLGLNCPHSHNAFESWLHPQKYRTLICKDRENCNRPVCFFAHGSHDIRMPCDPDPPPASMTAAPGHISQFAGTYAASSGPAAGGTSSSGSYRPQVQPGSGNSSSMQMQYGGSAGPGYLQGGYGVSLAAVRTPEHVILQPGSRLVAVTSAQQVQQLPVQLQTPQGSLHAGSGGRVAQSGTGLQQQYPAYAGQQQQHMGAISEVSADVPAGVGVLQYAGQPGPSADERRLQALQQQDIAAQLQQLQLQQQMRQQQLQHQQQARQLQLEHQLQLQQLQHQQVQQLLPAAPQQQPDAQQLQEQLQQLQLQQAPSGMLQFSNSTLPSTGRTSGSFEWSGGNLMPPQRTHSVCPSYELVPSRSLSSNFTGRTSGSFTSQSASHALLQRMRTASGESFGTVRLSCDLAQGSAEDYGGQALVLPVQAPTAGDMQQAEHLSGLLPQLQGLTSGSSWGRQLPTGASPSQGAGQQAAGQQTTAVSALQQDALALGSPVDLSPVQQQQQQQLGIAISFMAQQGLQQQQGLVQQQQLQQQLACQGLGTSVSQADVVVSGLLLQS